MSREGYTHREPGVVGRESQIPVSPLEMSGTHVMAMH